MSNERRKIRIGTVIQDQMDKTVVVAFDWRRPHSLYRKPVRRRSRFYVHDESNECRIGDQVRIIETRPLSKTKRWRVVEILSRIDIAGVPPQEIAQEVVERMDVREVEEEAGDQVPVVVDVDDAEDVSEFVPADPVTEDAVEQEEAPEATVEEAEPEEQVPGSRYGRGRDK